MDALSRSLLWLPGITETFTKEFVKISSKNIGGSTIILVIENIFSFFNLYLL